MKKRKQTLAQTTGWHYTNPIPLRQHRWHQVRSLRNRLGFRMTKKHCSNQSEPLMNNGSPFGSNSILMVSIRHLPAIFRLQRYEIFRIIHAAMRIFIQIWTRWLVPVPCHIFFGGFSFVVGATIYIGGSNNKQKSFRSISRFYYFFLRRVKEIFGMQRHTLTMVRKRLPVFSSSRRCVSMAPVLSSPQPHSNSSAIIFLVIKRLNHLAEKYSFFV